MSNVGQSVHGIHGYFAKGVSMGWPYYVCLMLVRVSMESADTLPKGYPWVGSTMYVQCWSEYPWNLRILCQGGYPWVGHTMYGQCWSEYPWNPWILCQGGIHGLAILCMSNVGQSIHGLSKAYPWIGYYVYPMVVSVWYNKGVTIYISAILSMSKVSQCISIRTMHTLDKTH